MPAPSDRKYLQSHEWHQFNGDVVTIGITDTATEELTDITFVSLPKVGDKVQAGSRFGEIESVKATSDLYCGVTGTVVAVNDDLSNDPGLINHDPYQAGWMIRVQSTQTGPDLLSADDYLKKTGH